MNLMYDFQTLSALTAIAMILLASRRLKQYLLRLL